MQTEEEPFVPIDDLARHFSVSVSTVRTWARQGRIPRDTYIKLGNTYRFRLSAVVEALLETNAEKVEEEKPTEPVVVPIADAVQPLSSADVEDIDLALDDM